MIPKAKERALVEALERDGRVTFKNGSTVERIVDQIVLDAMPGADGEPATEEVIHFLVTRPDGGIARFGEEEARRAYAMALEGPRPKEQPSGDGDRFGDDPPW